tara:strand:+ start:503 stop:1669 length:1167 start_codon:yes stop_codon:yes gene_type:complete
MTIERYYFDHNATTPLDKKVLKEMMPVLECEYGNASSIHSFGQQAANFVERSRRQVATLLTAKPSEIVFTSGGTEAANLAIFGTIRSKGSMPKHVITSTIEHPAVLQACQQLKQQGIEVTFVGVGSDGIVDPNDVRSAVRPETALISIMHINNELGTEQPISEIAAIAHEIGAVMHTDGVQSAGRIPTDMDKLGVDLFSLSAHKFYGPKGIGALFVRRGVALERIQYGGSHERSRRPGTLNVSGIVGLGAAAKLAKKNLGAESARLTMLRDRLEAEVLERIDYVAVNGAVSPRVPNTTNLRFDFLEGEAMVIALDLRGFAVSSGAACSSGAVEPSHVLIATGLSKQEARSSIRFSLGKQNTEKDVEVLLETLPKVVGRLRALSPTYVS